MDMNLRSEAGLRWVSAGAISLALHVVVLALFAWSGGEGAADAVRRPDSAPASAETPSPPSKASDGSLESASVVASARSETKVPEPIREPEHLKPRQTDTVREAAETKETPAFETYVVKRGDSLTHIAQDCGSTIQELARLNGSTLKKLSNLRVGQRIKIPRK